MNEEIDDNEFYHEDFTTASDWEILIARIEELVNQWRSEPLQTTDNAWTVLADGVEYADTTFTLTWHRKPIQNKIKHVLDEWFDFTDDQSQFVHSSLANWYNFTEFLVLTSSSVIQSESKSKILISALTVLSNNLDVPLFVQIKEPWQQMYCGVYHSDSVRTSFDIIHLKRGPLYCQHLTGLLDLYKTKLQSPVLDNILVSCRLTYVLKDFGLYNWISEDNAMFQLPFGVSLDPVSSLVFQTSWSCLSEHSVIDSDSYSDFDPLKAPKWVCRVQFNAEPHRSPICLLADSLLELYNIIETPCSVADVLSDYIPVPEGHPFDLLTEPFLLRKLHHKKPARGQPPLEDGVLVRLLYFLFPDADEMSTFPYGPRDNTETDQDNTVADDVFKGVKTCDVGSLVWRVAIVMVNALRSLGGLKAFCHVWYEFVQELRYRWEHGALIPGVVAGVPDLRTCLLNQKVQMLNCCIERKVARETQKYTSARNSDESDEEFYDATDDVTGDERQQRPPVARLSKFGALKLLKTGHPLYIPVTQDPVLKTEDQLEEDTDVLLKLGTDSEASELRARIMSASLLSDMESFKAANPGAILEDFIRWYSPRDWVERDETDAFGQKMGVLSARMMVEGNIWAEMWQTANPVPAYKQKRLFDDTREAEKVLQYFETLSVGRLAELIVPVAGHVAVRRLIDACQTAAVDLSNVCQTAKQVERMSRDVKFQPKRFETFIDDVTAVELCLSRLKSLQYKFNPENLNNPNLNQDIGRLVQGETVEIEGKERNPIGFRVISMFPGWQSSDSEQRANFPVPTEREFVLRSDCPRPKACSIKSPQFMRAILRRDEFRLVGAFSEDTTFY